MGSGLTRKSSLRDWYQYTKITPWVVKEQA